MFDGQSLSDTPNATGYPFYLTGLLASKPRIALAGVDGSAYSARSATAFDRVDVLRGVEPIAVFHDDGGTTDLVNDLTAAQLLTASENYAGERRSLGNFTHIVRATLPPSGLLNVGQNNERLAFNDLVRASSVFDLVVDWAAHPSFGGVSLGGGVSPDGTHFNAAGHSIVAGLEQTALATIGIL